MQIAAVFQSLSCSLMHYGKFGEPPIGPHQHACSHQEQCTVATAIALESWLFPFPIAGIQPSPFSFVVDASFDPEESYFA